MNKGNKINENPTRGNGVKNFIIGLITGGLVGYMFARSIADVRKSNNEERDENSVIDENEIKNKGKDQNTKSEPKKDSDILDMIHESIIDDTIFGPDDIIVVENEEDEEDDCIDSIYPSYVKVRNVKNDRGGYISILIKLEDELSSKNRFAEVGDPAYKMIDDFVSDVLESKYDYTKFRFKYTSKPIGFYFFDDDEKDETSIKFRELRELESMVGFRYIEFRFYNLKQHKESGAEFICKLLEGFHPDGGEIDNYMNYMPVIIDKTLDGIYLPEENNLVRDFLRR